MFQFEQLLKENNIPETDPNLPRAITKQIEKFRNIQNSITPETGYADKEKINDQLDELDNKIMQTLSDFFDIEDEEEIKKQEKKIQQEKAEKEKKQKEEQEALEKELNKPATNDDDALDKLFRKGKTQVTLHDLKSAGFNTGFFGNLGPHGCDTKRYKLLRDNITKAHYDLIKK